MGTSTAIAVIGIIVLVAAFLYWRYRGKDGGKSLFSASPDTSADNGGKERGGDRGKGKGKVSDKKDGGSSGYYDEIDDLITSIYSAQLRA